MKRIVKMAAIMSLFGSTAFAQQRYITTLGAINGYNNNPAYAGLNNCLTVNLQGKKQWLNIPNSPTNAHLQLTQRIGRNLGVGFQANYWSAALLSNVQSSATIGWHFPMGKTFRLGIATNIGFSQVSLNYQDAITYQTDPTLSQKQNTGNLFADVGILIHSKNFQFGIASPSVYNMRLGNNLNYSTERYIVANAQYKFIVNDQLNLTPIAIYRALPSSGYLVDGMVRAELKSRLGIAAGYRTTSGLLASVDVKINEKVTFAYAYDAGLQNLNGLSKGSHEILLGLSICKQEPKPRYIQRYATILVKDEKGQIAPDKVFTLVNQSTGLPQTLKTNEKGIVVFPIDTLTGYSVTTADANYESVALDFATENKLNNDIQKEYNLVHKAAFVSGKIVNEETGEGISDVKITKVEKGVVSTFITDSNGEFRIPLENKNLNDSIQFSLTTEKEEFIKSEPMEFKTTLTQFGEISLTDLSAGNAKEITLTPYKVGGTINEVIAINPIYFDYNRYDIRPDAATELEKVIQVLNQNPTMTIEVGAHSDCSGAADANQRLSEKRAQSCVAFIQKNIENPSRVSGKGYGETVPLSANPCEKRTTEELAKDRRIEFKIVKL